ncbi:FHA domain-containing protein [Lujinxingia vulgaris]|uniref:FHA domain-containing protein n=1 Tax=Lujinxingia vulgaris TaxID=2600176 RepID=A0A5C6WZ50_9DELT|nr:FHA domain-containing protein [Lujinxingia vulgaris]TXD34041.1 FHA domain-containing protein [Lujinxingia vulgaris]
MAKLVYTDASGREMSVELGPQAPVVSIGRATDCTIRSNRKSVSRHHAEFHYSNGRYEIVDLNSSNGTYLMINDERKPITSSEFLQDQDEVWCGDFILRFYQDASQQPAASAPQLNGNYGAGGGGLEVEQGYGANRVTQDFGQEEMGGFGQGGFGPGQNQNPNPNPNPNQGGAPSGFGQNPYDSGMGAGQPQGGGQNGFGQNPYDSGMGAGQGGFGQNGFDQGGFDQGNDDDGGGVSFGVSAGGGQYAGLNEPSAGYDDVLEIDPRELASEVSEVDPYAGGGAGGVDVARLQEEKRAIEELAARQADELEGLRRQLEEAQIAAQQGGGGDGEAERLSTELREALEEKERLSAELRETREASQEAIIERERGEDLDRRLQEATARIDELRARAETAESQLEARGGDVDLLERELERAQEELRAARGGGQAREELEAARKEAARQERLLGEFERRNRDLQAEQVELNAEIEALRAAAVDAGGRLEAAQAELASLGEELEGLRAERDTLQGRAEAAEGALEEARAARASLESLERDLRGEIEGLKQRLKLERERARGSEAAGPAFDAGALRAKMESLDRIVDAIERTDLQPLSTVDRVRLQSAIRDTAPRRTLKEMMDALSEG